MAKKYLIINGPNLNMLGKREPDVYGDLDLKKLEEYTEKKLKSHGFDAELEWYQSNSEGEIVEKIHTIDQKKYDGLVINPAAYSHTSVAILDALKLIKTAKAEVHLSMTLKRETYRQTKLTAQGCDLIMEGLGKNAYFLGVLSLYLKT